MNPLTIVKGSLRTTRELWDYLRSLNIGYKGDGFPADKPNYKERIEQKQAVVDSACHYIHNVLAGHHGPNDSHTKKALIALHQEVDAYQIQEMDL